MKAKKQKIYKEEPSLPSLVQPWLAAVFSAIIPGLGQALGRAIKRGIIIFASFASLFGMLIWRFQIAAPRDTGIKDIVLKAFKLQPIFIVIAIFFILTYIWNIVDAYQVAKAAGKPDKRKPFLVFFLIIFVFFLIGWQIGKIDLYGFFSQLDDSFPILKQVIWPWEKAISYPTIEVIGKAEIFSPCTDNPPPQSEPREDKPYLIVDPTCGDPTMEEVGKNPVTGDWERMVTPGTEIHLEGFNYDPDREVEIWWRDSAGRFYIHRDLESSSNLKVTPDENGYFEVDVVWPFPIGGEMRTNVDGVAEWELQAKQISRIGTWEFSEELELALVLMIETIFIGMMATFFGVILSVPVSFLAARNLMNASAFTLGIYYATRFILNVIRSIEPLIWAILAIIIVGLGPFAGILALTVHSIAALGKLYSEAIESIDPGPIEAVQATGANWFQIVMFGVVPQIIPPFVSFTIYRWDINIRMSTIIGIVGGGGIGYILVQWIRNWKYQEAGIAVWLIAITVAVLDYVSAEIRERFV
jgi:phosphonate transport system permease protein